MSVFVTDGDQRSTLAVVRALGGAGIPVTVGESRAKSLAGSSRYCARRMCYPSPRENPLGFQESLSNQLARGDYRVLIPMTDVTTRLAAGMRENLGPSINVPVPSLEAIHRSQDKAYVLELAQRIGIPCPRTLTLGNGYSPGEISDALQFPLVIKPRFSFVYQNGCWRSSRVQYAFTPEDLKCAEPEPGTPLPLVQERLSGEGRGVFLLVWDGELKGAFCHRRLREKPPWGGVSVHRESIPLDERLLQQSFDLLRALEWQGVAMIEFKLDRDGTARLMEVNGRFWGSLQLAIDSGANFPLLLYRLASGENPPPQLDYRVGVKSRWLLGDLDSLLITMRNAGRPHPLSPPTTSRVRALAQFLNFYERGVNFEIFRGDDMRPGWFESRAYLQAVLAGLWRGDGER